MKKICLLILSLIFIQCSDDIECFTPPSSFMFSLVDSETGENLITNGSLEQKNIKLYKNNVIDENLQFINENDINFFTISDFGWKTEIINYEIRTGNTVLFTLYIDAERVSEKCTYTKINELKIENALYELDSETGIYKIKID